jgi:hypothetical protein
MKSDLSAMTANGRGSHLNKTDGTQAATLQQDDGTL